MTDATDASADALQQRSAVFDDPSQQSAALDGWDLRYVQLSAGRFAGAVRQVRFAGVELFRESNNVFVNQFGAARPGSVVFGSPLVLHGPIVMDGRAMPLASIGVLSGDREFNAVQPPMDLMGLSVATDALADYLRAVEPGARMDNGLPACIDDAALAAAFARRLMETLDTLFAQPTALQVQAAAAAAREELLALTAPLLLRAAPPPRRSLSAFGRTLILRQARDYLHERIDQPVQVSELCRQLRVSRRALQYAFEDGVGTSPACYLRLLRLNGARRELLRGGAGLQVQDVIARWGFWHFSRFSAEYRRMYGELPSQTLRAFTPESAHADPARACFGDSTGQESSRALRPPGHAPRATPSDRRHVAPQAAVQWAGPRR